MDNKSEDVEDFLARIASLKDRRDREDEERTRKLEEEILEGRRTRQERRAERARSLSPSKASPAPTVLSVADSKGIASRSIDPPIDLSSRVPASIPSKPLNLQARDSIAAPVTSTPSAATRPLPTHPGPVDTLMSTPGNTTGLSRSGTLSWQQRPTSRDSNTPRPRPLSGVPAAFTGSMAADALKSKGTEELSRSAIAQSLGSKDASWFKQTSDRGLNSAAYRKNQVESESAPDNFSASRSMRLPGMSRERTAEPERPSTPQRRIESGESTPPREVDTHSRYANSQVSGSIPVDAPQRNVFAMPLTKSQRFEPSMGRPADLDSEQDTNRVKPVLAAPNPLSDRPPSPTKGLGGFVQSAMMKRSDSVNKRWSVQSNAGLKRGDSIASNHSALAAAGVSTLVGGPARSPKRMSRALGGDIPSSPLGGSRPSSSHGEDVTAKSLGTNTDTFVARGRTADINERTQQPLADAALPVSPTKTMEPRRWSPTKASWLESALTRPESPKPMPPPVEQPSWRSDLQRSKHTKASEGSITSPSLNFNIVSPTSLLRSPPPGGLAKPLSVGSMPEGFSPGPTNKAHAPKPLPNPTLMEEKRAVEEEKKRKKSVVEEPKEQIAAQSSMRSSSPPGATETKMEAETKNASLKGDAPVSPAAKATREPPAVKPKPQTPPKTDFRSNLKSRQDPTCKDRDTEPEFKAIFGKLKRTQTQNYKAPDELKDNISRGKAALATTGGPQKTKRVDEFIESILEKKEAMKAGGGSIHGRPESKTSAVPEKPATMLPEALARRQALSKPAVSKTSSAESRAIPSPFPTRQKPVVDESRFRNERLEASSTRTSMTDAGLRKSKTDPAVEGSKATSLETLSKQTDDTPSSVSDEQKALESSKIAARLNPSLVGFLSRSSSPHTRPYGDYTKESFTGPVAPRSVNVDADAEDSATLTHMTKARAKGPKRRAPKSEMNPAESTMASSSLKTVGPPKRMDSQPSEAKPVITTDVPTTSRSLDSAVKSQAQPFTLSHQKLPQSPSDSTQPMTPLLIAKKIELVKAEEVPIGQKLKPLVAVKSPELREVSSSSSVEVSESTQASKATSQNFKIATDEATKPISSPPKPMRQATPSRLDNSNTLPLTPSTSKVNSPRISRNNGNDSPPKPSVSQPLSRVRGLGLDFDRAKSESKATAAASEPTPPLEKDFDRRTRPCVQVLGDVFDQMPSTRYKAEFDTEQILSTPNTVDEKTKTLDVEIWEINGDGRKQPMPPAQEHILFEECMYLCTNTFQNASGSKSTEVYLWSGDGVADAAVEDAQLFSKKTAREKNGKLQLVKQGKESSRFFQALGGIVITRRSKSSSLYMLCGRRHLGHVAFDEVDLDPANLCSGFPYIISAKFGKMYLWKGQGSGADELGCARLMGMDLCLTGEMEEINEGEETAAFFESFPNANAGKRKPSSEIWLCRGSHPKYTCRLWRIEHDRPKSAGFWGRRGSSPPKSSNKSLITEILPFCQKDLEPGHIYILDNYWEFYVFVGSGAASKFSEFMTAAMLAREMSYLAPSVLDRPVLPLCYVVFGEPHADFIATFRKWQTQKTPPSSHIFRLDEVLDSLD